MIVIEVELFDLLLEVANPLCEFIMMVGQFVDGLVYLVNWGTIGRRGCVLRRRYLTDVGAIKQEMADVF